ncbi:2-succinyl-6-hydroxy-2,4-cyclohexadiene-1-carboxylate synthase [Shewanella mesophila]|nr:2-succinyl-6-hydroxy-2,4-cyclohexadiene-1-carboxylate synthase [Shewanella mesophila]QYJ88134.1 2-succinyl-6-hydroxy-2,4-cyclohexadiene-1-carboxylate synthase [Shewanella mesophila]
MLASSCYGDPSKPALVLLHGFLGNKQDWQTLMPRLSQHFYCVCLDLPGHGDSPSITLDKPGFVQVSQVIEQTLAALNVSHFHLLGYSLGGRIALHIALLMPEKVLSMTLESCHYGLDSQVSRSERLQNDEQWDERLQHLTMTEFLTLWYRQAVFADLSDDVRANLIKRRANNTAAALRSIYLATSLGQQQHLSNIPNQLVGDWHYFVGKQDKKFMHLAQQWQSKAPIKLHFFENAGHNIHLVSSQAFCNTLIQHLLKDRT